MTRKGGIKRAGDILSSLIERLKLGPGIAGWSAVSAWNEIIGSEYAGHTKAIRFDGSRLVVQVDSSSMMARLGMDKPVLLKRIETKVGSGVVEDLMFVMAGRSAREEDT